MKKSIFFFILFSYQIVSAQKIVEKTISNTIDTAIQVDANNCFELIIETVKTNKIVVEAKMAGEYGNDLALNIHEEGSTLLIDTSFNPNFELPNDKLAAHKTVSISLHISVPENLKVSLYGTYCNVTASGVYRNLNVALNDGKCILKNVDYKTEVFSQSGSIELYTKEAEIEAVSNYGEVISEEIPKSNTYFNLNTITGNIHIYKTN
tara:strand:+ start:21203 stop:21823 length:621 start_codon:yes stop_codon:yes gene_type:complete